MLYYIKGKFYILVSGFYKEVTVEKKGKEYLIKPLKNGLRIENNTTKYEDTITLENAYDIISKKIIKE